MVLIPDVEAPGRISRPGLRQRGTLAVTVPAGVDIVEGESPENWAFANGVAVFSDVCGHITAFSLDCEDLAQTVDGDETWGEQHNFFPLWVDVARTCAVLGGRSAAEIEQANRERLEADIGYQVAHELYTGALTGSPAIIVDPVVITSSGALPVDQAFELLEQTLATVHGNLAAVIHISPAMLIAATAAMITFQEGDIFRTATGHVVIGDAGYTGQAPTGDNIVDENGDSVSPAALGADEEYIYATGPVAWQYGPGQVYETAEVGGLGARKNKLRAQERRSAIALFDPDCIHYAVLATYESSVT